MNRFLGTQLKSRVVMLAMVLAILCGAQNLIHIISAIIDPLQLDYSEGLVLAGVYRISQNPALSATYSFNPTYYNTTDLAYPPVFPYMAALLDRLLGLFTDFGDSSGAFRAMYAARTLTLGSLMVSGGLIYWFGRRFGANRFAALTGAALFFCFHPTIYWGVYARVDTLGLAFTLGGLALVIVGRNLPQSNKLSPGLWFSLIFFALAFFTKQSLLAAPAAVTLYLCFNVGWRKGLLYAASLGLIVAAGVAALAVATGGNFLFFMTMERFTPFVPAKLVKTFGLFLLLYAPLTLVGVWGGWRGYSFGRVGRLLALWGGLALLVSFSIGKAGAADYYFFEIMAFGCIQVAIFLSGLSEKLPAYQIPSPRPLILNGLTLLQIIILLVLGIWLCYPSNDRDMVRAADGEAAQYVREVGARSIPVFGEMSGPLVAAGRPEQFWDHFIFRQLARAKLRDGEALVQDFANKRYKLALFGYDILTYDVRPDVTEPSEWPPGFEQAVRNNYRLLKDIRGKDGRPYAWALVPK